MNILTAPVGDFSLKSPFLVPGVGTLSVLGEMKELVLSDSKKRQKELRKLQNQKDTGSYLSWTTGQAL